MQVFLHLCKGSMRGRGGLVYESPWVGKIVLNIRSHLKNDFEVSCAHFGIFSWDTKLKGKFV